MVTTGCTRDRHYFFLAGMSVSIGTFSLAALLIAQSQLPFFRDWKRVSDTPILSPMGESWQSAGTFNPAVIVREGKFVMLYRAQDAAGTSRLGYGESADGVHFTRRAEPVLAPEADYEKDGGVEDPRLVQIGDRYYLTYTGYNKTDAQLCLATSQDLLHWKRLGVILPAYQGNWNRAWTKSGAIVSEKINGKYWMYWLGTAADKTDQMGLSSSTDLLHWHEETETPVLPRRAGRFDSRVVEPGPPPILTPEGIVLIYNGADDRLVYRTAIAVLIVAIRARSYTAATSRFSRPNTNGRKSGRFPMWFLSKAWPAKEMTGCFTMAAPTNMSVWPEHDWRAQRSSSIELRFWLSAPEAASSGSSSSRLPHLGTLRDALQRPRLVCRHSPAGSGPAANCSSYGARESAGPK